MSDLNDAKKEGGKRNGKCYVYLDGKAIGHVRDGKAFAEEVRKNRRNGIVSGELNVTYISRINEVHINADRGRARKPYIVVENGVSRLTPELKQRLKSNEINFNYLIRRGVIEFLDAEEEENVLVAPREEEIRPETTHLDPDPASMFSLTVNNIVFPEYNTVGKHSLASGSVKQGQGLYAINFNNRYDSRAFLMYYPQRPVVNTSVYRTLNLEKHASGQNFVVALSTYYGYSMDDATILNKAAVERGLGRAAYFKSFIDEERRYPGGQQDTFKIPPATAEGYLGEHAYSKLSEDGIIEKEQSVSEGDVIIGKVSPPRFIEEQTGIGMTEERGRDNSTSLRANEEGVIDDIVITETTGATKLVKVRMRSQRIPEIGDKFESRHGQKGIVALLVPQEDMPFTKEGVIPDMLLNPTSIPSRMTFGHMLETMAGKVGAMQGNTIDGTPFSGKKGKDRIDEYGSILEGFGFDKFGDEVLYDGRTGKPFPVKMFQGVVFYNRLLHMVSLKQQVRSRGPVQILTRQPTEGKPRRGGLRFGEMERDALVGHGASLLLKERMLEQSDKWEVWVCKKCGDIGYYDYVRNMPVCQVDGPGSLVSLEISYAFKLLLDEIKAMHILPKVTVND